MGRAHDRLTKVKPRSALIQVTVATCTPARPGRRSSRICPAFSSLRSRCRTSIPLPLFSMEVGCPLLPSVRKSHELRVGGGNGFLDALAFLLDLGLGLLITSAHGHFHAGREVDQSRQEGRQLLLGGLSPGLPLISLRRVAKSGSGPGSIPPRIRASRRSYLRSCSGNKEPSPRLEDVRERGCAPAGIEWRRRSPAVDPRSE